ncbi:MAG: S41 family peptidase [Puia sp.]|nr:S41 family peptidase [Puia sp.]
MCNEEYFNLFYYWMVERPDSFVIRYKDASRSVQEQTSPALSYREISRNLVGNPVNADLLRAYKTVMKANQVHPWRLEIFKDSNAALLTIRSFGGGKDEAEAKKKMHDFLGGSMRKLRDQHTGHLVVDLRYNGGGCGSSCNERPMGLSCFGNNTTHRWPRSSHSPAPLRVRFISWSMDPAGLL